MSTAVTRELHRIEGYVPAPDMLLLGPKGAFHTDVVKVLASGTVARGTLLMLGTGGDDEAAWLPCTAEGLGTAKGFAILADAVTIGDGEHAEAAAYFEGDFNEAEVVLPWLQEGDDREAALDLAREPLRQAKIFLRPCEN